MRPETAMNPSMRQLAHYGWRPADPPRQPVLFVNPRSGGGKAARAGIAERARAKGIEAIILTPGQDLAALARSAAACRSSARAHMRRSAVTHRYQAAAGFLAGKRAAVSAPASLSSDFRPERRGTYVP